MGEFETFRFQDDENDILGRLHQLPGWDISPDLENTIRKKAIRLLNKRGRKTGYAFPIPLQVVEIAFIMGITAALGWDVINLIIRVLEK